MDGWVHEWMEDGWIDGSIDGLMDGRKEGGLYRWMMYRWMDGCWMAGWLDGWVEDGANKIDVYAPILETYPKELIEQELGNDCFVQNGEKCLETA